MNFQKKFTVSAASVEYLKKCQKERKTTCTYFLSSFDSSMMKFVEEESHLEGCNVYQILKESFGRDSNQSKFKFELPKQDEQKINDKRQSSYITDQLHLITSEVHSYPKIKKLLEQGTCSDVTIVVGNEEFLSHKHILCARSPYFAAMLQVDQRWCETRNNVITLKTCLLKSIPFSSLLDLSTWEVYCICRMVFISSSTSHRWDSLSYVQNLVQTADMLGPDDFMYAVCYALQKDFCHFFHKPCSGCIEGVPLVLSLSDSFNMMNLFEKCMRWSIKHLIRVWPTKTFSQLPNEIHEKIVKTLSHSINIMTVVSTTLEIDGLFGRLTEVKWARPINEMALRLMQQCQDVIVESLFELTSSKKILQLFQGMGLKRNIIEEIGQKVMSSLSVKNASSRYIALQKLLEYAEEENWNQNLIEVWKPVVDRTWSYLLANYFAVIHTKDWNRMPEDKKKQLKDNAISQGDPCRKPRQKPVLSSSKRVPVSHKKKKAGEEKKVIRNSRSNPPHENARSNDYFLPSQSAKHLDVITVEFKTFHFMQNKDPHIVIEEPSEEVHILPTAFKPYLLVHKPYIFRLVHVRGGWEMGENFFNVFIADVLLRN